MAHYQIKSLRCALRSSASGGCERCEYCAWRGNDGTVEGITETRFPVLLIECKRRSTVHGKIQSGTSSTMGQGGKPAARSLGSSMRCVSKRKFSDVNAAAPATQSVGMMRLQRFLRLLSHLDTAPWASVVFDVNDRMIRRLTAAHLHLIIGKENFNSGDRAAMYHLIDPSMTLDGSQNLVWVTNRQQGKTSTMGKFIAALALASPMGGQLANVYSTSLDRAIELTKSAKEYVTWMMSPEGKHREFHTIKFVRNNYNAFSITTNVYSSINEVASKPKNPDSCRGDAPHCAFFDEIGFIEEKFWYKFALPLLQVSSRIATCTTTPPPADSFFAVFVAKIAQRNAQGDHFFRLENHSLACAQCIEMQEADQCCHNLHYVPPWKSMMRFVQMRNLIPTKQIATFQTEVYGVLAHEEACYFPKKLVDAMIRRARHRRSFEDERVPTVWVGIDPAGHTKSELAICATVVCPDTAMVIVVGLASVSVAQCQVTEVQAFVSLFLRRLRQHPNVHKFSPLVPIVETNLNEVFAMSIVSVFSQYKPVWMPFTSTRFHTHIVDGIGVLTTKDTKMSMVQLMYSHLLDGRLLLSADAVTVGRADFDSRLPAVPMGEIIQLLSDQLKRFRDQDDGTISGKNGASGDNDDCAMALMLVVFWSLTVRATESQC